MYIGGLTFSKPTRYILQVRQLTKQQKAFAKENARSGIESQKISRKDAVLNSRRNILW